MRRKTPATAPLATAPEGGPDVRQLRAFVTLVDVGRITTAAKALGLAQSTVSEALASLERALGTQVIVRAPHGAQTQLTAAGRALLPHARGVLDALRNARLAVAAETSTARAEVRIIANESVSTYLLPAALAALRARWPNTRCSVSVGTCGDVREGVSTGVFDVGLMLETIPARASKPRHPPEPPSSTAERRLVTTDIDLVVFSKPLHRLVRGRSGATGVTRDDVTAYPLFTSDAAGDFHVTLGRWFGLDRATGRRLEAAGSVEGVKQAVSVGEDALGVLPAYAIDDELKRGVFAVVPVRPSLPRLRLNALLSRSRTRHPATEELLLAIRQ